MTERERASAEDLVEKIKAMRDRYASAISMLKPIVDAHPGQADPNQAEGEFWRLIAYYDSLVRIRILVEQNFNFIETIGLLGTTRYLFEVLVWLRNLARDSRYGLLYNFLRADKQYRYWVDYRENIVREVTLFKRLQEEEHAMAEPPGEDLDAYAISLERAATLIDEKAARHFSVYGDAARHNGYGFQAELLEGRVLPEVAANAEECRLVAEETGKRLPKDLSHLANGRGWQWKAQAQQVGMKGEYEFIYTYCSRLLHATPISITTNQKNLEMSEVIVFLRFVRVSLQDILEIASSGGRLVR